MSTDRQANYSGGWTNGLPPAYPLELANKVVGLTGLPINNFFWTSEGEGLQEREIYLAVSKTGFGPLTNVTKLKLTGAGAEI